MVEPGQDAPDFSLADQDGNQVALSELRGETIVLYFYPRADTPGCTTQACGVRDRHADYSAAGARVIGLAYVRFLHRMITTPETTTMLGIMRQGAKIEQIIVMVVASEEYNRAP